MTDRISTSQEIEKDAMSEIRVVRMSFPPNGYEGLDVALKQLERFVSRKQLSVEDVKKAFADSVEAQFPKLSKDAFLHRAGLAIFDAERLLSSIPEQCRTDATLALEKAFQAGLLANAAMMREKHLRDVTREEGQKKARSEGGNAPKARKVTTNLIVEAMDLQVRDRGMSIRSAASLVHRQKLGTSADANRKLYSYWKKCDLDK